MELEELAEPDRQSSEFTGNGISPQPLEANLCDAYADQDESPVWIDADEM